MKEATDFYGVLAKAEPPYTKLLRERQDNTQADDQEVAAGAINSPGPPRRW